jgi:DNA-binding NtrC family response regulator
MANNVIHRILVVDDNRDILSDFFRILCENYGCNEAIDKAEVAITGEAPARRGTNMLETGLSFTIDSACQGQEALEMVRASMSKKNPYLMAFIDVRMPPGWDGIETISHLWEVDPDLEVVICTAYSDYSWYQMATKLNRLNKFVVLKKPFEVVEVVQLVHSIAEKRRLQQELRICSSTVKSPNHPEKAVSRAR